MIYRLSCACGATFNVDERAIGRRFTCTGCQSRIRVDEKTLEPVSMHRLTCECGTAFRVEEKAVGGTFQCPKCQRTVRIAPERLSTVPSGGARVSKAPRSSLPVQFQAGGTGG